MKRFTKFLTVFAIIGVIASGLLLTNLSTVQGYTGNPVTLNGLINSLKTHQYTDSEIVNLIKNNGVDFQVTFANQINLTDAGASDAVIEAAKANYRPSSGGTSPPTNAPATNSPNTNGGGGGNTCTGQCGGLTNPDFDKNIAPFNNPINIDSFPELVVYVLKGFFFLIGLMAVLIIVIGGVRLLLSQGNQESITKGKQTIIWAVAGLIVALLAYSIVAIIQNLLALKP